MNNGPVAQQKSIRALITLTCDLLDSHVKRKDGSATLSWSTNYLPQPIERGENEIRMGNSRRSAAVR